MDKRKKGGFNNKKMKKFPKITDYLETHHKDVFDLIDDLAMHGTLTPKRGGSITFLLPDDKYVQKIRKIVESDKPEEATDMVSSLILLDLFETPNDFASKQDDIPTALGRKLIVKSVASNKVIIDDGELTLDTGFKPFDRQGNSKRGNLAVWKLKGEVKYLEAPKANYVHLRNPKMTKKEGGNESYVELYLLIDQITNDEVKSILTDKKAEDGTYISPIISAVARILRVFSSDAKFAEENQKARSILTKHPIVDFYLLFKTPMLFSCDKILEAYRQGVNVANNVEFIKNYFNSTLSGDVATMSPKSLMELNVVRDEIRSKVQEKYDLGYIKRIESIYKHLDETNILEYEGIKYPGKVYPECLANIFKQNPGFHMALDDSKYFIYRSVQVIKEKTPDLIQARKLRAEEYANLFAEMKACYQKLGESNKIVLCLGGIDSTAIYQFAEFWKTFGLHLPVATGIYDSDFEERVYRGGSDDNIYSKDLIDIDKEFFEDLEKYDNSPVSLSENTINELKAYYKVHGKYPEL